MKNRFKLKVSRKADSFTESVIREMTRFAARYDAINLAQGYPDFSCPEELKKAASQALYEDYNQYSITWGSPILRRAIAAKEKKYNRIDTDPEKNVVVTCGTTEAMIASQIALLDPGDEVIIFSPHYENYGPDAVISGARPRYFELDEEDGFSIDEEKLKKIFNSKTRGLVLNTPNNPTGKVFTRKELKFIADLCVEHDTICFTDEIYEYILYDGKEHVSMASLPSMRDRTVTISGFSKTYSVTGWRVGYTVAEESLTSGIKKIHDFLTVGAPHPLQIACAQALSLPEAYYVTLRREYQRKRDMLLSLLGRMGFRCFKPFGAYYIWCDYSGIDPRSDDVSFATNLVKKCGVAGVPGSSFFGKNNSSSSGNKRIRFTFSKKVETLEEACTRLSSMDSKLRAP